MRAFLTPIRLLSYFRPAALASRLVNLFIREIVSHSTHGIDLHTAAIHRTNLPQIRANLDDEETDRCAKAFNAPVMLHSTTRDGSLRQAATKKGIPVLLYESGEALRFDSTAIDLGIRGILKVMEYLGMYEFPLEPSQIDSQQIKKSKWIRASCGGMLHLGIRLGQKIRKKQELGFITDAFGKNKLLIRPNINGIVIGYSLNPLVNQGDGIVHLGIID